MSTCFRITLRFSKGDQNWKNSKKKKKCNFFELFLFLDGLVCQIWNIWFDLYTLSCPKCLIKMAIFYLFLNFWVSDWIYTHRVECANVLDFMDSLSYSLNKKWPLWKHSNCIIHAIHDQISITVCKLYLNISGKKSWSKFMDSRVIGF